MFNLFKGKKKEFFLEIDDSNTAPVTETTKPAEEPKPDPVKVEAPQVAEETTAEPAPKAEEKTKKKSPRAKKLEALKKESEQKEQQATPEPQPEPKSAPKPVAAVASSSNGKAEAEGSPNFATEYFTPMAKPRRRPGPNMNMYMDMARQMRKSKI